MPTTPISSGGGSVSDGDKGDITVSASGATWTIDAAAVTLAKMANLSQDTFIIRTTASTGVPETATCTAAGRAILDDADAAAQRTTLGIRDKVVQRVSTFMTSTFSTTTQIPSDNTIPQNTEGGELATLAITPTSTSNKLVLRITGYLTASALASLAGAIFRDSTADALYASLLGTVPNTDYQLPMNIGCEITPASTSSETYKLRIGPTSAATVQSNQVASSAKFSTVDGVLFEIWEVAP